MNTILDESFLFIKGLIDISELKITSLYLSNQINCIKLNNSSVGACLNYYKFQSNSHFKETIRFLDKKCKNDPLLENYLFTNKRRFNILDHNLRACIVSALSQKLIMNLQEYKINYNFYDPKISEANSAVIVGFGGLLKYVIKKTSIKKVHILELRYNSEYKEKYDKTLNSYINEFPNKEISISDGSDYFERFNNADLISITGSSLCNGTLDQLLSCTRKDQIVIVQGHSASIIPHVLFDKGVSWLCTVMHPENVIDIAIANYEEFVSLYEGGIPYIYITNK